PMIAKSDVELPWEPYTGGVASPNPDYPQEVKTVKGKNILDCRGLTKQTKNGGTFTPVYDNNGNLLYINVNGTFTAQTDYIVNSGMTFNSTDELIFSTQAKGSDTTIFAFVSTDGQLAQCNDTEVKFRPLSESTVYTCYIRVRVNQTISNLKFYPMIRSASVADSTYVPYGLMRIKTHGKNSLNATLKSTTQSNGVTCTYNGDGTYTLNGTSNTGTYARFHVGNILLNGTYKFVGCPDGGVPGGFSMVLLENNAFGGIINRIQDKEGMSITGNALFGANIIVEGGYTCNDLVFKPMLTKDLTATYDDFASYQESSIVFSEPIELCGIGDAQDVIDVENGVIRKRIFKYVFTGDENITTSMLGGSNYNQLWMGRMTNCAGNTTGNVLCNKLIQQKPDVLWNAVVEGFACAGINNPNGFRFRLPNQTDIVDTASCKAKIKEWYDAGEPMYIVSELSTGEELIDLPVADRIALNNLKTYDEVTYLELDCYVEPTFSGTYGASEVSAITLHNYNESCIDDIKPTNILNTTTKAYLTGTTSATTNNEEEIFDTGVYLGTTPGELNSTTHKLAEKVTMAYNSTTESLDFTFL
ncbi:MAG: hypothetical protein IJY81_05765, partial [Lachnospiraceae bacterium]|nr:hypothetical protein [Lachnospiraceae bacterium]